MEREAVSTGQEAAQAGAGGPVPSPEQLGRDVREALSRCAEDPDEAGRLNALMPQLGPLLGASAAAGLLQEVLAQRGLPGAADRQGRSCRSAAVEALLFLGHPHALTVRPEDLRWYRAEGRRLPWAVQVLLVAALAAAADQVWEFGARAGRTLSAVFRQDWEGQDVTAVLDRTGAGWEWTVAAAVHGAVAAGALGMVMASPARTRWGRTWQVTALLLGVLGGVVTAFGRSTLPAGVCALLTFLAALQALQSGQERGGGGE
ncbi:MAG: hypothetical protein FJ086_14370 [Deltaproteobacteria bacterium]|nr:hypothetical protein [Deltaproteobacteria bacterium]